MATLRALRTLVQREVMSCPPFIVDTALNKGARAFLEIARFWRKEVEVNTAIGAGAIDVLPPGETESIEITAVRFVGTETYLSDAPAKNIRRMRAAGQGLPKWFGSADGERIELLPYPDAVYPLVVELAVRPLITSMTVDDIVLRKCGEGIALAAVADLRGQPGHPWSDPAAAAAKHAEWEAMAWKVWHRARGGFTGSDDYAQPAASWV